MSLKAFHILFIISSILLSVLFGVWAIANFRQNPQVGFLWTGIISFLVAVGLAFYMGSFKKKVRT